MGMDSKKGASVIWLATMISMTAHAQAQPTTHIDTVSYANLYKMAYSGQAEQAIQLTQQYLKNHENPAMRILLACMLIWNKQFDAAREQLYFVLSKNPGNYHASDCLSEVELWLGNYSRAIAVLNHALKYNPDNEVLLEKKQIIFAKQQVSLGHREQAISIAKNYLRTHHDSLNMRIYLATQLSVKQQYDEAIKLLQYVLEKKPASLDASLELADIEIASLQYAKALDVINHALQYAPQNTELLNKKQLATLYASAPHKARISYDDIKNLSRTHRQKAIKLAMDALKQDDDTDIRTLLGLMLSWEGRYNEAYTISNSIA